MTTLPATHPTLHPPPFNITTPLALPRKSSRHYTQSLMLESQEAVASNEVS